MARGGLGTRHSGDCLTRLPGAVTLAREVSPAASCRGVNPWSLDFLYHQLRHLAMNHGDRKDDWYCKSCDDFWGGHYVNRGHRAACYKCKLSKGHVFGGKPSAAGNPSQRVVPHAKADTGIQKEIAKLRAENIRLKQAAGRTDGAPAETDEDELEKLVAKAKSVRSLVKSVPELGDALAALDTRIAGLRADRLKAKPGSERLRQLETETKRKQAELASAQSKRAAAQERIAKEQSIIAKLDADGVALTVAIAKLQESVAKLAEEFQATTLPPRDTASSADTATAADAGVNQSQILGASTTEQPSELDAWVAGLAGESQEFAKAQRASMGDEAMLQLRSLLKGKGKGGRPAPYS